MRLGIPRSSASGVPTPSVALRRHARTWTPDTLDEPPTATTSWSGVDAAAPYLGWIEYPDGSGTPEGRQPLGALAAFECIPHVHVQAVRAAVQLGGPDVEPLNGLPVDAGFVSGVPGLEPQPVQGTPHCRMLLIKEDVLGGGGAHGGPPWLGISLLGIGRFTLPYVRVFHLLTLEYPQVIHRCGQQSTGRTGRGSQEPWPAKHPQLTTRL